MVLLYVDALGMKARWAGGVDSVKRSYSHFERLLSEAVRSVDLSGAVSGGVQSDALALVCRSPVDAVRIGRALFASAFRDAAETQRLWLRGLILPTDLEANDLVVESRLDGFEHLYRRQFADPLLQAVNVEQRFKGPRLLIAEDLVSQELKDAVAISVGSLFVVPLRRLRFAPAPDVEVAGPWWDVLYLMPTDVHERSLVDVDQQVGRVIRWAARVAASPDRPGEDAVQLGSQDELAQLSLLSVMWAETESILRAVGLRAGVLDPIEDPPPPDGGMAGRRP